MVKQVKQGDLALLEHPVAKELLASNIPARLAYVWTDGTPRVLPIWFHWNGRELVLGTSPNAAKLKALTQNPKVALTIDDNTFPHKVLLIRGTAQVNTVEGVVPEWAQAAERYFGPEKGKAWVEQIRTKMGSRPVSPSHRNGSECWTSRSDFREHFRTEH